MVLHPNPLAKFRSCVKRGNRLCLVANGIPADLDLYRPEEGKPLAVANRKRREGRGRVRSGVERRPRAGGWQRGRIRATRVVALDP